MKRWIFSALTVVALIFAVTSHARIASLLTLERRDWSFIESVGGMTVEFAESGVLKVACDVSGTQAISNKPTMINSGIGVRKLNCSRAGNTIRLSVETSVIGKAVTPECGDADVSTFPAGAYDVVYLNPDGTTHSLGKITLR